MDPVRRVEGHGTGAKGFRRCVVEVHFNRTGIDGRKTKSGVGVEAEASEILPVIFEFAVDFPVPA